MYCIFCARQLQKVVPVEQECIHKDIGDRHASQDEVYRVLINQLKQALREKAKLCQAIETINDSVGYLQSFWDKTDGKI